MHKRAVACDMCGKMFFPASLKFHQKSCAKQQAMIEVPCGFCDRPYLKNKLAKHMKVCKMRPAKPVTLPPHRPVAGHGAGGAPLAPSTTPAPIEEFGPSSDGRMPCVTCGRKFAADRIGKHQSICRSLKHRVPKVFDSSAQRVTAADDGAGGGGFTATRPRRPAPSRAARRPTSRSKTTSDKWRTQSEELRRTMREARRAAMAESDMSRTAGSMGRTMIAALGSPDSGGDASPTGFGSGGGAGGAMARTMGSTGEWGAATGKSRVSFADSVRNAVLASREGVDVGGMDRDDAAGSSIGGGLNFAGAAKMVMRANRTARALSRTTSRRPTTAPYTGALNDVDAANAFHRPMAYASDYKLSNAASRSADATRTDSLTRRPVSRAHGGSRPVSRAAARKHFSSTTVSDYRPKTSAAPSRGGRFNETHRPKDGRVRSKVNHFEAGADRFTYGGWAPEGGRAFGGTAPRFQDTTRVHAGLIDGYTATEAAKGIKPGRLVTSNATSASNPLATSTYQIMEHADARAAPSDWRRGTARPALSTSNATSYDNPLASSTYQVMEHPAMPGRRR